MHRNSKRSSKKHRNAWRKSLKKVGMTFTLMFNDTHNMRLDSVAWNSNLNLILLLKNWKLGKRDQKCVPSFSVNPERIDIFWVGGGKLTIKFAVHTDVGWMDSLVFILGGIDDPTFCSPHRFGVDWHVNPGGSAAGCQPKTFFFDGETFLTFLFFWKTFFFF